MSTPKTAFKKLMRKKVQNFRIETEYMRYIRKNGFLYEFVDDCFIAVKVAKSRWETLRNRYVRVRKTQTKLPPSGSDAGDTGKATSWSLYSILDAFLHYHVQHRE